MMPHLPRCFDPHPILGELWAGHEAFARLGFDSKDLFVIVGNVTPEVVGVQIQLRHPERMFVVNVGCVDWTCEQVIQRWREFTALWNAHRIPKETTEALWMKSWVRNNAVEFITALVAKGFEVRFNTVPLSFN